MNLSSLLVGAAVIAIAATTACSSSSSSGTPAQADSGAGDASTEMKTSTPSADTTALWSKSSGYKSWPKFMENATPKLSSSHMKSFVITFHNDVVTQAISNKTLPLPDGAILVKENYMRADDPMPMALTVMSKQGGKWYWVEEMPDGTAVIDDAMGHPLEGYDVAMCVGCHATQSANDSVYTHNFSQ